MNLQAQYDLEKTRDAIGKRVLTEVTPLERNKIQLTSLQ